MADATEYGNRNQRRKCSAFRARSAMSTQRTTHVANGAQIAHRFDGGLRHRHRGVSNPPGRPRDGSRPQNRGVAHAPAPSVTPAKCVSCAAQNAALVVLPLSLQVVGVERLAREALADTGSSTIGFD